MKKRIFLSPPDMTGREFELVKEVFDSNYIAPVGPMLTRFEEEFCAYTGFKYACAVASGTAAIHLGLKVLGVRRGDIVLSTTLTFIGGVAPIAYQNSNPFFIDCDMSFTMNPYNLERLLLNSPEARSKIGAVILTDLYGQCCDMEKLLDICDEYDIPTLVDAAESLGATAYGKHAGKGADIAAFSFNGNKIITTSGGGMIASDNKALIDYARHLSTAAVDQGFDHYEHSEWGYNYRMSNVLAAIGVGQLEALDEKIDKKRTIFNMYREKLSDINHIAFMPEQPYGKSTRWQCIMFSEKMNPSDMKNKLEEDNIESRRVFKPMHLQPTFKYFGISGGDVSEYLFKYGLCLPCGTSMTEDDIDRVCKIIKREMRNGN